MGERGPAPTRSTPRLLCPDGKGIGWLLSVEALFQRQAHDCAQEGIVFGGDSVHRGDKQGFQAIIQKQREARVLATSDRRALPFPSGCSIVQKQRAGSAGVSPASDFRPEQVMTQGAYE
jgi:hypothetical protein